MTNIDKAIGENIGWRHAVTWCIGGTAALCLFFAGQTFDGVRDELRDMNKKLDNHAERIAVVEVLQETFTDRMCIIEKSISQHVYKIGP